MKPYSDVPVLIVGGGPVGLFLACALLTRGIECVVSEKRPSRALHSRAIGLHPPGLTALASVGVADEILRRGVPIRRAQGFFGRSPIGHMSFAETLPPPFDFALTLPQSETEALLEHRLGELDPDALRRGEEYIGHRPTDDALEVSHITPSGVRTRRVRYLIGCDGGNSRVREQAGIPCRLREYPDRYAMGDFADTSGFGDEAALFLTPDGITESFPLPGGMRRWVVHLGGTSDLPESADALSAEIHRRTGRAALPETCAMHSRFRVRDRRAARLVAGNVLLAGDAAHVCSPMGGQGMNCGLIGAARLADALASALSGRRAADEAFPEYDREQRRRARIVADRAHFNTWMGRGGPTTTPRALLMAVLLRTRPTHDLLARVFTMQGL